MGSSLSSLVTSGGPQPSSLSSTHISLSFSLGGQLKSSNSSDRGPAGASDWTSPSLLPARGVSHRLVRLLWSPPTSPCPINHFLSERSLFDRGNQEIPLYLLLISKPASPLNIKLWFWDDPGIDWAAWWAESDVIYCICVCVCVYERWRDPQHSTITQRKTDLHIQTTICATEISCHFTAFLENPGLQVCQCKSPVQYSVLGSNRGSSWPRHSPLLPSCPPKSLNQLTAKYHEWHVGKEKITKTEGSQPNLTKGILTTNILKKSINITSFFLP